jgi:hypothetical protein
MTDVILNIAPEILFPNHVVTHLDSKNRTNFRKSSLTVLTEKFTLVHQKVKKVTVINSFMKKGSYGKENDWKNFSEALSSFFSWDRKSLIRQEQKQTGDISLETFLTRRHPLRKDMDMAYD